MIGRQFVFCAVLLLFASCYCIPLSHGFQSKTVSSIHRSHYNNNKSNASSKSSSELVRFDKQSTLSLNLFAETTFDGSIIAAANDVSSNLNTDVFVFLAGVFPFAWATVEFSRRVMVGEAFGTGSDQVIIGMDDSPADSRGRRVLGRGALITAIVLFMISFATIGIVLYSVVTSDSAPEILPETSNVIIDTLVL